MSTPIPTLPELVKRIADLEAKVAALEAGHSDEIKKLKQVVNVQLPTGGNA